MGARIATAAVGIPIVLYAVAAGNLWPLKAFVVLLGLVAALEFVRVERLPSALAWGTGFALAALMAFWTPTLPASPWLLAVYVVLALEALRGETPRPVLLLVWVALPLASAVAFRSHSIAGVSWSLDFEGNGLLLTVLCLWAGDTAALLVGKVVGRHKLAPNVSPAKTWEGAAANLLACVAVGWLLAASLHLQPAFGASVGAICGVLGQAGDLFQSLWKRRHGVKDAGVLLPGHGGVLDRFDSLIASLPAVNALAYWWSA